MSHNFITKGVQTSLLAKWPEIRELKGVGPVISDRVLSSISKEAFNVKKASQALLNSFIAGNTIIKNIMADRNKEWVSEVTARLLKTGADNGWTIEEIARNMNSVVGQQHVLDGLLLEALVPMCVWHFLGKKNVKIYTQVPTGAKLGGRTDTEFHIGNGRFLMELKTLLGSDWKRHITEHFVNGKQLPFFLLTLGFNLREFWVKEMKEFHCQPVTVYPSVVPGVISFDSFIAELKKEIERVKQTQVSFV